MRRVFLIYFNIFCIIFLIGCTSVDVANYEYQPEEKTTIVSQDDQIISEQYSENRTYVKLEDIPEDLIKAIVSVEDNRFYKHKGYDIIGIFRAAFTNVKEGEIAEGASTITQQLARNIFEEITTEQTFGRKINEVLVARQLEKKYDKDQILEMYLNEIYLGAGTFGVQEASRVFLGKDVWDLNLAECALIAGLPQAPSAYSPDKHFERAKKRQETVLNRMVSEEYITEKEAEEAKVQEIVISKGEAVSTQALSRKYSAYIDQVVNEFGKIMNEIYPDQEVSNEIALERINKSGLTIYTTLNTKMQDIGFNSLNQELENTGLSDNATGAFMTIGNNGAVLAYYGGNTELDMASIPRQPGSTIKPLIYSRAYDTGSINSNTLVLDEPLTVGDEGWSPQNAGGQFNGYMTIREAIVNSINIPVIKTMRDIGIEDTMNYLKKFGITTVTDEDKGLSTALGGMTYGISPLELAQAYTVFNNQGIKEEVHFIKKIIDSNGSILYENDYQEKTQVIEEKTAHELQKVLADVVNRGTGTSARLPYITGGKTGTTNNSKDLWFVGFTGNLTSAFWIGNVDNNSVNGSSSNTAKVYKDYMENLIEEGLLEVQELEKVAKYDNTVKIKILSPEALSTVYNDSIPETDIIDITVPEEEVSHFNETRISSVYMDGITGKVFNPGTCPDENKVEKFYLLGQEPSEVCNKLHLSEKVDDYFNEDLDENYSPDNRRDNEERRKSRWLKDFIDQFRN